MPIPEPVETFMLRLGFDYSTLRGGDQSAPRDGAPDPHERVITRAFFADHTPIIAVFPADCRVDVERLGRMAGLGRLRAATAGELGALYPESEPGTMPPLGPLYGQEVFVDDGVAHQSHVVFSAGTRIDAIRMRYGDFAELVHPTVARFAVPAEARGSSVMAGELT